MRKTLYSLVIITGLVVVAVSFSGCTRRVGELTLISTKQPQYDRMGSAALVNNVQVKKGRTWFLFIPFNRTPNYPDLIDKCLEEGQGDFMQNVRFYKKFWTILLFSHDGKMVRGDVGNSKGRTPVKI